MNHCFGIFAHVDAGKTTFSEQILYHAHVLRAPGRVDHQDTFLDAHQLEKKRGITIFSDQAHFSMDGQEYELIDTPGHVDFSAEMERTLQVLDYAILVVSGTDGVQAHTQTLWRLLERHHVPTFLFINKMDIHPDARAARMAELKKRLGDGCIAFDQPDTMAEEIAMCDEALLERYLETGCVEPQEIASLIRSRKVFPCYFGSALRLEGVEALLDGLERYTQQPEYTGEFGAQVFKITRDGQGNRLSHLKITGGTLAVRALLSGEEDGGWQEKVNQIRVYSGEKFQSVAWGWAPRQVRCRRYSSRYWDTGCSSRIHMTRIRC